MAFHEKAGRSQVRFFFFHPFLPSGEFEQSGPEQSRARVVRRQRTLDGEDRSVTIPLRKGKERESLPVLSLRLRPTVATLPSALFK